MPNTLLVTWIGRTDLRAASGDSEAGPGPIAQAIQSGRYQAVHLISDFTAGETKAFTKWIATQAGMEVCLHTVKLSSPIDFGQIYERVVEILDAISKPTVQLTFHLSPGTPAMASVWILLAKTTYPARLIQSSAQKGVEEANIPFDISAEFIPQLLQRSDERLSALAMGAADEDAVFESIIHRSAVMKRVIGQARRVAIRSIPVLIEGESGTGKELMARAIHRASPRERKSFITVNCGAIPPELVESEFFGHKKGSFTGAATDRKGHFELAHGGTIFLDEIGELPKPVQVKLLRTLQEGEVTPVGSSEAKKVDVRVVAATNRTLMNEVASGNFREDLFYRLAVAIIKLPPLRERAGDISLLIDALLRQVNDASAPIGIKPKKISVAAKNLLLHHPWPGNIRELLNTLQRAAVWSDDEMIGQEAIKDATLLSPKEATSNDPILNRPLDSGLALEELMAGVARHYLQRALDLTKGNKTQAAGLLGFRNYQTMGNWMEKYDVER
ncbi:MAG: sigma 54-interacting transcriptional regulator [Sulfuritalea sp.]|nr:sigma 54-interacting transcriptional regulator [Sulfuritalea sp.]